MRLFVGVPPSDEAREALDAYADSIRAGMPDTARWVPRENLHFTVQFVGEVPDESLDELVSAFDGALGGVEPFSLALGRPGCFPTRGRARVLWVGAAKGEGELALVAGRVSAALAPWVRRPEDRPFAAHLTLARFKPPSRVPLEAVPAIEPAVEPWMVTGVTLYRSRLMRPAPVYEALHQAPLS